MTSTPNNPDDDIPKAFKWVLFCFILAFVVSGIAYAVLLENRHTRVSIDEVNLLIKDCKVSKVYEIGSPSHRRPNRLRTIIELKDGQTLQTELGTHATIFKPAIDRVKCPVSITTLEIT